jgi:hypothetical protein
MKQRGELGAFALEPQQTLFHVMFSEDDEQAAQQIGTSVDVLHEWYKENDVSPHIRDHAMEIARVAMPEAKFHELTRITWSTTPTKKVEQFKRAAKYAEENDMVGYMRDLRRDFTVSGFKVFSEDKEVEDTLNKLNKRINADSIVLQLANQFATFDNMALLEQYSSNPRQPDYFKSVSVPSVTKLLVHPLNVYMDGQPQYMAATVLPYDFIQMVKYWNNYAQRNDLPQKVRQALNSYPKKIRDEALDQTSHTHARMQFGMFAEHSGKFVFYDERDGEYLSLYNYKGQTDQLASPTMMRIFRHLDLRDLMLDGDFTVHTFIKYMIHQVKLGDPNANRNNPFSFKSGLPSQSTITKMRDKYSNYEKAMQEVTGPFHTHDFIHPDPKLFDGVKYEPIEKMILNWAGLRIFIDPSGNTYSSGYIYTKGIQMFVKRARHFIERLMQKVYAPFVPEDASYDMRWDYDIFKDPKQVHDEVISKLEHGLIDPPTAAERVNENPKLTASRIREIRDNGNEMDWIPIHEAKQGISQGFLSKKYSLNDPPQSSNDGDPGNPRDNGEPNPSTPRQPRPSEGSQQVEIAVVRKEGDKWYVYSKDGEKLSDGYDTKKEAEERLREIEYFKDKDDE